RAHQIRKLALGRGHQIGEFADRLSSAERDTGAVWPWRAAGIPTVQTGRGLARRYRAAFKIAAIRELPAAASPNGPKSSISAGASASPVQSSVPNRGAQTLQVSSR